MMGLYICSLLKSESTLFLCNSSASSSLNSRLAPIEVAVLTITLL